MRQMQKPGGLSKKHILFGGVGLLLVVSAVMMMGGHQSEQPAQNTAATAPAAPAAEEVAAQVASQFAGFKGKPPEGYKYTDTSADTPGQKSFGIESETRNQKVLFLVWDNDTPVDNLDLLLTKVPFMKNDTPKLGDIQVDRGSKIIGGGPMPYFVGRYTADSKPIMVLLAAYRSPVPGKAIIVIAKPFDSSDKLDYGSSLWLVDTMAAEYSAAAKKQQEGSTTAEAASPDTTPLATPEELADYRKAVEGAIKANFNLSKEEAKKTQSAITIAIDTQGKLSKLEVSEPSGNDAVDQAVLKAIKAGQPFPNPPHTKDSLVEMKVTTNGADLAVKQN